MFDNYVMPGSRRCLEEFECRSVLKVTGLGESALDNLIAPVYSEYTIQRRRFSLQTRRSGYIEATASTAALAAELAGELAYKLEDKLGEHCYSTRGEALEEVIGNRLRLTGYTIATAESCTGV
jgi:nicotinamide-nucleotide amidase